jgi:hypothetical protein
MRGFVKNISTEWQYAMKRSVRPGGEIPLKELFEQYGKKYNIKPNNDFVEWLHNIKLRNKDKWRVVYDSKNKTKLSKEKLIIDEPVPSNIETDNKTIKQLQVEDLTSLTVRKAREVLPKIMDLNLLKYSLTEARQLSEKDSLCRLLTKRVKELQISR